MEFTTQLWVAISNNPTHGKIKKFTTLDHTQIYYWVNERDFHPPWCLIPKDLALS